MKRQMLFKVLCTVLLLALLLPGVGASLGQEGPATLTAGDYVPGEMLVKFQPGVTPVTVDGGVETRIASLEALAQQYGITAAEPLFADVGYSAQGLERIYKLSLPATADVLAAAGAFAVDAYVEYAEPNYIYYNLGATPTPSNAAETLSRMLIANGRLIHVDFYRKEIQDFLSQQSGILKWYIVPTIGNEQPVSHVILEQSVTLAYEVNPKALIALLELETGLISNPSPSQDDLDYAMHFRDPAYKGLERQIEWAAQELWRSYSYYALRESNVLEFADGTRRGVPEGVNAATYAIEAVLAKTNDFEQYQALVEKFVQTYRQLFDEDPRAPTLTSAVATPFLNRPYDGRLSINSFFDHRYPRVNPDCSAVEPDGKTTRFDGKRPTGNCSSCELGYSCYDGHDAYDYGCQPGAAIKAAASGSLHIVSTTCGGVVISHDVAAYKTRYWHMATIDKQDGQRVEAGDPIGTCGKKCANGYHLDFTVKHDDKVTDVYGWWSENDDPWPDHVGGIGTESFWLWAAPSKVVDDTSSGFEKFYVSHWEDVWSGYGGHTWRTYTTNNQASSRNWAIWVAKLPTAGSYQVFAYWPEVGDRTNSAKYQVFHQNGRTEVVKDQNAAHDSWVSLGTFYFDSGARGAVILTDLTNDSGKAILFDAIKWEYSPTQRFPTDPYFTYQWGLHNTGQTGGKEDADIDAPEAWGITTGTTDVIVAVIDTGVDYAHEDLDDGRVRTDIDKDYVNDHDDAMDDHGHGTHVAGIIAAETNNGIGVAGVMWQAQMLPIKVLSARGSGYADDVAKGIRYAADQGADVINMSLGSSCCSQVIADAVNYAYFDKGVVIVAAAGNDGGSISYPAKHAPVIAVGATDDNDHKAYFSNFGDQLDVVAPGVTIFSTVPNNGYDAFSGTSMASPHVAGVAGLLLAQTPDLSQGQVREILRQSADDLGQSGFDRYYGYGRVNAYQALQTVTPDEPPAPDEASCPCGASAALANEPDGQSLLGNLRAVRDKVFTQDPGRRWVRIYYEHQFEVAWLLMSDSQLRADAQAGFHAFDPVFRAGLDDDEAGPPVILTPELIEAAERALMGVAERGSPAVHDDIVREWEKVNPYRFVGWDVGKVWEHLRLEEQSERIDLPIVLKQPPN